MFVEFFCKDFTISLTLLSCYLAPTGTSIVPLLIHCVGNRRMLSLSLSKAGSTAIGRNCAKSHRLVLCKRSSMLQQPQQLMIRLLGSSRTDYQSGRSNSRSKRRDVMMAQKYAALENMIASSSIQENDMDQMNAQQNEEKEKKERLRERQYLLEEAKAMTKSHYRRCLRCVDIIRPGNDHDEAEFQAREKLELEKDTDTTVDLNAGFSMALPVDRKNELSSRANYYEEWIKENFHGEKDCLDLNPWQEETIHRFLHLLRDGERKRQWVLEDYKFEDVFVNQFDHDRLNEFEKRATALVKNTYDAKGWVLQSSLSEDDFVLLDEDDNSHWDDDDDDNNN